MTVYNVRGAWPHARCFAVFTVFLHGPSLPLDFLFRVIASVPTFTYLFDRSSEIVQQLSVRSLMISPDVHHRSTFFSGRDVTYTLTNLV